MVPEQVGPYRIIQPISSGAAGVTYLAVVPGDEMLLCCVKTPHPMWARDPAYMDAFINEARLASRLDHPNIVRLREVSLEPQRPYLVHHFVEGLDLGELLKSLRDRRELLDCRLVAGIALSIARALDHAHTDQRGSARMRPRPGIIHRDICPANVVIGLSGVVYLLDFGIARALEAASSLRPSLHGSGRIQYAAPERLTDGTRYDARADLFSLGVVMYEMLTGVRPYDATSVANYVAQVREGPPRRIEPLRPEFRDGHSPMPPGLVRLVNITHRLIEPDPGHRFPSAIALVEALSQVGIPGAIDRRLSQTADSHMPEWRRAVRLCGHHPVEANPHGPATANAGRWASTDPSHVAHLEPDAVCVDRHGAERLLAHRYTPLVVERPAFLSVPDVNADDLLSAPVFDSTVPDRPTFDPEHASEVAPAPHATVDVLIPPPFVGDEPVIPETRDSAPAYGDAELEAIARANSKSSELPEAAASHSSMPATGPVSSVPAPARTRSGAPVATGLPAYRLDADGTLTPINLPVAPPPAPGSRSKRYVWLIGAVALLALIVPCVLVAVLTAMSTAAVVSGPGVAPQLEHAPTVGSGGGASARVFSWLGPYPPVLVDVDGDGYRDAIGFTWDFNGDDAVTAISGADARVLWVHEAEQDLSMHHGDVRVWVPSTARIVFADRGGNAIGIDARTGAERWRAPIGARGASACRIGSHLLITTTDQYTYEVAIDDGQMERTREPNPTLCEHVPFVSENRRALAHKMPGWTRHRPNLPWPRRQVLGSWLSPEGDRYLVEIRHPGPLDRDIVEIAAVRPDGEMLWQQPATQDWELASNRGLRHLAVEGGTVFAVYDMVLGRSDVPRRIAAFDYETGERIWDAPLEWQSNFDFLLADERRVYVGHWALEILDRADGQQIGRVGVFPNE